jgi:hypothetical protein
VWVYSAVLGAGSRQGTEIATDVAVRLVLAAADVIRPSPSEFAAIVGAARDAATRNGGSDPLNGVISTIFSSTEEASGTAAGAQAVVTISSELPMDDRNRIVRQVLDMP